MEDHSPRPHQEADVSEDRRTLSRTIRIALFGAGLSLVPAPLAAQEVAFDRLWSHDTGG